MIKQIHLDSLKTLVEIQANLISGGVIFLYVDENTTITWKKASNVFDMEIFSIGSQLGEESIAYKAMAERDILTEKVPRSLYGMRLIVTAIPIINEKDAIVGAFSILFPRFHPVASAFPNFAPILAGMFPEGVFLYTTDLQKVTQIQGSSNFNMPNQVGDLLKGSDIASDTVKTKSISSRELDESIYGVPVSIVNYPLFDEDDENEIVATFGIALPKKTAVRLRNMSENLDNGLSGISAALEQLAASASQIHANEKELNSDVQKIISLSNDINNVSAFIKEIADETKMLGLNAAIEAARAGEAGRGFDVVAEEIRNLSKESKSTVPKIMELTDHIKNTVDLISAKSQGSLHSSEEQAAATEEITASIEEITAMAEKLNEIARQL